MRKVAFGGAFVFGRNSVVMSGVTFGGLEALALRRFYVYDGASSGAFRLGDEPLHRRAVVTVDGTEVVKPEVLEIVAPVHKVFERLFRVAYAAKEPVADERDPLYEVPRGFFRAEVSAAGADPREVVCEPSDIA